MLDPGAFFGDVRPLLLIVGGLLLVAGRRLFWIALAVAGFVIGWLVGSELGGLPEAMVVGERIGVEGAEALRLGFAITLAITGLLLAFTAQRIAVVLAGVAVGGLGMLWLLQPVAEGLGPLIWVFALLGALLGIGLARVLFSAALVIVSSWIGAGLVTEGLDPFESHRIWLFVGLFVCGLLVQRRRRQRPQRR